AEERIARDKQLSEAQARIAALEKTVRDLQRTIEIKNESLAQVQTQADASRGKAPEPAKDAALAAAPATTAIAEAPKASEPTKTVETAKAAETKAAEAPAAEPKAAESKATSPAPKAVVKEPPGFFSDLLANMPLWAIVAGAL